MTYGDYGIWWFKMPIIYHPKSFVTNPKWFWGMIKTGLKMFWLDVRKTRLRVVFYYSDLHETCKKHDKLESEAPSFRDLYKHESYK